MTDKLKEKSMDYFTEIPEGQAIVCCKGVYRQAKIAVRSGKIYARYGIGYVRLSQGGATSHPSVRWYQVDAGDGSYLEKQGSVLYRDAPKVAAE